MVDGTATCTQIHIDTHIDTVQVRWQCAARTIGINLAVLYEHCFAYSLARIEGCERGREREVAQNRQAHMLNTHLCDTLSNGEIIKRRQNEEAAKEK